MAENNVDDTFPLSIDETIVEQFESAWLRGEPKRIAAALKKGIKEAADICRITPPVCVDNLGLSRDKMPQVEAGASVQVVGTRGLALLVSKILAVDGLGALTSDLESGSARDVKRMRSSRMTYPTGTRISVMIDA